MLRSFLSRAARARVLAARRPEPPAAPPLSPPTAPPASLSPLMALVFALGPAPLRAAAREIDEERCRRALEDTASPRSFFARVLFQAASDPPRGRDPRGCPRCGHPPQAGCLRPPGDGAAPPP